MKKTYIIPEMETIELESVQLLLETSISDLPLNGDDEIGSRFDDFWDI